MREDIKDSDLDALNNKLNVDSPVGPSTADKFARSLTPGRLPSNQDQRDQTDGAKSGVRGMSLPVLQGKSDGKGWSFNNPVVTAAKSFLGRESVGEGVKIDNKKGMGVVPDHEEIGQRGFTVHMLPRDFLALNPSRGNDPKHVRSHMKADGAIASPFLSAEWNEKGKHWKVVSHEGRGRMQVAHEMAPDEHVPVQVFPRGEDHEMRARHLTDRHLFAPIHSDARTAKPFVINPVRVIHQGKEKYRPMSVSEIVDALIDEGLDSIKQKYGIEHPEKAEPHHSVSSIGWSEKNKKWYGWSHRAIYGFGVGDPDYSEALEGTPKSKRPKIKSVAHAKAAAKRFARSVA